MTSFATDWRPRGLRVRTFVAIAILAPLIGAEVGMLVARPALHAPLGLRGRLGARGASPALRGPLEDLSAPSTDVAAPFVMPVADTEDRSRATRCLADAIYYEAALEPIEGRRAVAQVVLNRVRDPNFPKSVCGVVYDGWKNPPGCQFSFACDGSLARPPVPALYRDDIGIAGQALSGYVESEVGLATHYHATSVDPAWRADMVRVAQVGSQIFYRRPGAEGPGPAFTERYSGGERVPPAAELLARAKSAPLPTPPLPTAALAADASAADERPIYLYGRRMRSRAEVQRMNRWLEEKRPLAAADMDPST
jgi:hypothetical protein